ncbi:MAG TPA: glycoside hydrolase family 43 protein [Acidimicrobiales bacterium]|nr:glycoside hydrolase family 43 protein [Acidimicrobiales bacterium]
MTSDRPRTTDRSIRRTILYVIGAVVVVGLVVVGGLALFTNDRVGGADGVPVAHPDPAPLTTADLAPPLTTNPAAPALVLPQGQDQGDPFLLSAGNRYYLYTSQPSYSGANVPVTSGATVGDWGPVTDALPSLPGWAENGFTWAPDVHRFGSSYVLYFTAVLTESDPAMQCIGDAVGKNPAGPFVAQPDPFICQVTIGGSIDPRVFTDADGSTWMVWKSDENIAGSPTPTGIWTSRLSSDGLTLVGSPTTIFAPDEAWQSTVVEAPELVLAGGHYWLFYSANWFDQPAYGIGVASCAGPRGPCRDLSNQPFLSTNSQGQGPGEESVFVGQSGVWMLYNPWRSYAPTAVTPPRPVAIARIGFGPFGPYLGDVTGTGASGFIP